MMAKIRIEARISVGTSRSSRRMRYRCKNRLQAGRPPTPCPPLPRTGEGEPRGHPAGFQSRRCFEGVRITAYRSCGRLLRDRDAAEHDVAAHIDVEAGDALLHRPDPRIGGDLDQ